MKTLLIKLVHLITYKFQCPRCGLVIEQEIQSFPKCPRCGNQMYPL